MSQGSILVIDANILIRAVLGQKVRAMILAHCDAVDFFTPDVCMADAKKYLPKLFEKRSLPYEPAINVLMHLESIFNIIGNEVYGECEVDAKRRVKSRDINDWPIIAAALKLNCPIWTEDQDFFGTGISVWTTNHIAIYFENLLTSSEVEAQAKFDPTNDSMYMKGDILVPIVEIWEVEES